MSLNYEWIAETLPRLCKNDAQILDFGCGKGRAVRAASRANPKMNIRGVDTYERFYDQWKSQVDPDVSAQIEQVARGPLPFDDETFDLIYANQVFEHVFEPEPVVRDIGRLLKPNGVFLALFPCRGTWYEGHVGVYFAHWLMGFPKALRLWLRLNHMVGFGLYRDNVTRDAWVEQQAQILEDECIYHRWRDVQVWLDQSLGGKTESLEHDNMRFRLNYSRLKSLAVLTQFQPTKMLAILVHRLRGGRVFVVRKVQSDSGT